VTPAAALALQPGTRALRFDAATHTYAVGLMPLPSVTQVLKAVGVSRDWSDVPAEILAQKREIGIAAHLAAHFYDDGTLAASTVDPRVEPYLQSWIGFREFTGFLPALLETRLHHPGMFVAGTLDRAGCFTKFDGHDPNDLHIVDIKCGEPDDAGAQWQTAAYAELLAVNLEKTPFLDPLWLRVRPRYSVQLLESGRYKLRRYTDTFTEWMEFCAFVTTFRRQHARRSRQSVTR